MTNISQSSALKAVLFASLAAVFTGCGPGDGKKEYLDARAAYEAGDYKRAEKLYLRATELNPSNVDALVSLAELELNKMGEPKVARSWIARAEELAADDEDVRLLSAQIAWHDKDYARAEKIFTELADDETLQDSIRSQGWTGLGIVQVTNNEHDLARLSYLRAIRLDRRNASAYYHLGHLYRYAPFGYAEAALEQFDKFVHLSGAEMSSPRVQKTQQSIIPGLKETIARAATERPGVAQRNSRTSLTAISKADAAAKKGNFKVAKAAYHDALVADPLSYPAALGLARMELKTDSSVQGQKRALEAYRTACGLKPSAIATLLEAGRLAERLAQPVQAREIYSRALAANPASVDAVDGLIRAIQKANGDKKIAKAYQDYRNILPVSSRKR